jgi:hypothetical protein
LIENIIVDGQGLVSVGECPAPRWSCSGLPGRRDPLAEARYQRSSGSLDSKITVGCRNV